MSSHASVVVVLLLTVITPVDFRPWTKVVVVFWMVTKDDNVDVLLATLIFDSLGGPVVVLLAFIPTAVLIAGNTMTVPVLLL